jgi:simple sugar transport system permease protein
VTGDGDASGSQGEHSGPTDDASTAPESAEAAPEEGARPPTPPGESEAAADEPDHSAAAPPAPRTDGPKWLPRVATGFGAFFRSIREANTALVTLLALIVGLFVGAILITVTSSAALNAWGGFFSAPGHAFAVSATKVWDSYRALFDGSIVDPDALGHSLATGADWTTTFNPISETMVSATPLILAGLGVAIGFQTGVFNIGGQGQFILGAMAATYVGFAWHLPPVIHVILIVIAGAVGGAVGGFIPGILKARTGAHEVIVTIMLNYIFLDLLAFALKRAPFQRPGQSNSISKYIPGDARLPHLFGADLRVNVGFLIALAAAIGVWWLMRRSTLGFTFTVVGSNPEAGRAAGMNAKTATMLVLVLSGALVGLGGMSTVAGTDFYLSAGYGGNLGFDAITVALLGRNRPLGVVLGALLFGAIGTGARQMQLDTGVNSDLASVIQAVIVFCIATPALIKEIFRLREGRSSRILLFTKGWSS